MKKPEVSVIIPVLNGKKTIEKAIESAYAQEADLEVIVIDDGSADGTCEQLQRYLARENFCLLRNETTIGVAASRNRGVRKAVGKYVAFLDADDWWETGKLKAQLQAMERTGVVLSSTGRELMDPEGRSLGKVIPVYEDITYRKLLRHNSINCSSVVLLRQVALEYPMEHEDSHEDYITWLKILRTYGHAVGINEPLLKYRMTEGSKSGSKLKSARMTYSAYRYAGLSRAQSLLCFVSYAAHGVWKYR